MRDHRFVLIIPAFDESFDTITTLINAPASDTLSILILNTPSIDTGSASKESTLIKNQIHDYPSAIQRTNAVYQKLIDKYPNAQSHKNCSLHCLANGNSLLLIQRLDERAIPYKQGVGLARKIGNDCASLLIEKSLIQQPVLFNTDADVQLPVDYFDQVIGNPGFINEYSKTSAWLFSFFHSNNDDISSESIQNVHCDKTQNLTRAQQQHACEAYEKSLRHYVNGLAFAGSDYAFQTIGSTLALNPNHYCAARGFPKKNAGEDFYLLNKLRKLGNIISINGLPIQLSTRASQRVPFGTGPAIQKILSAENSADEEADGEPVMHTPLFYPNICFEILRSFLSFWHLAHTLPDSIKQNENIIEALELLELGLPDNFDERKLTPLLESEARRLNLFSKLRSAKSEDQWQREFRQSFDAFRTLKFLHYLRDQHFPLITTPVEFGV